MFNRTSRFIIGAALLAAMPVVANASTGRLEGMSLPGDYTKDYTAIFGWPSSINGVGNLVYAEVGNQNNYGYTNDRAMGAVLPNLWDGKFGTWGIHLQEETPSIGQGDYNGQPNPGEWGFDPNSNTNQQFDIMWGKKFGGTNFGLRLNRSYLSLKDELPGVTTLWKYDFQVDNTNLGEHTLARNVFGVAGGLGFTVNDKTNAEVAVHYQTRTYEASTTNAKFEDNGGSNYLVQGRMMWKWQPNVLVVPVVKFYSFDLGQKSTLGANVTTYDNTLSGWQAGLAGNWSLGSNDLFVLGATIAQNTVDQQSDIFGFNIDRSSGFGLGFTSDTVKVKETSSPMVFMALESQVNSWLTLRFGANKYVFHTEKFEGRFNNQSRTITLKDSPFNMNIGASVKVGSLTFDAVLDDYFYNNPAAQFLGNYESNFNNSSYVFQKVSATYTW